MEEKKKQHYVPRVYLKQFIDLEKIPQNIDSDSLWEYDKNERVIRIKRISDICKKDYFYSYVDENNNYNHQTEDFLSKIENGFTKIINRSYLIRAGMINRRKIDWYNSNEMSYLVNFILFQYFRVPKFTNSLYEMTMDGFKEINRMCEVSQSDDEIVNDVKKYSIPLMFDVTNEKFKFLHRLIIEKNLYVTIIPDDMDSDFIITDSPVLITNLVQRNAIIHPNTEITIPLTRKLAVSFYGPGSEKQLRVVKNTDEVEKVNESFCKTAQRYCCSGSRVQLEVIKDKLMNSSSDLCSW